MEKHNNSQATDSEGAAVIETDLPLPNKRSGKVRDIYDCPLPDGSEGLLLVATDRVSAFDVVLPTPVPGRGIVLTQISDFWFDMFRDEVQSHLVSTNPADVPGLSPQQMQQIKGRMMLVKKTRVIPIECIVRGYLTGSGLKDYNKTGRVCGIKLPEGMVNSQKIENPIFTPSTKAEQGHDENISFKKAVEVVSPMEFGPDIKDSESLMLDLRDKSIRIYSAARDYAIQHGIIIADTKFEFGLDQSGNVVWWIDEALTPDSSRFWPADLYEVGKEQPSMDKQILRNYLQEICDAGKWDKTHPGPSLPPDLVERIAAQYRKVFGMLTGREIEPDINHGAGI